VLGDNLYVTIVYSLSIAVLGGARLMTLTHWWCQPVGCVMSCWAGSAIVIDQITVSLMA
jgi:hypothetical protein